MSGKGILKVTDVKNNQRVYAVEQGMIGPVSVTVNIGEQMQWEADPSSSLVAYEVCFPPYENGRYEDIGEV